jgi:hypothetical protein
VDVEVEYGSGVAAIGGSQLFDYVGRGGVSDVIPIEGVESIDRLFGSMRRMNGEVECDGGVATIGVES